MCFNINIFIFTINIYRTLKELKIQIITLLFSNKYIQLNSYIISIVGGTDSKNKPTKNKLIVTI